MNSQEKIEALFNQYSERIYAYLWHRCGRRDELARDLTQDVFVQVLRRDEQYDWQDPLGLLIGMAKNLSAQEYRTRHAKQRVLHKLQEAVKHIDDSPLPEELLQQEETKHAIAAALAALPAHYEEVLVLKYEQGLAVKGIAVRMQSSEKAVESLLTRARQAFAETLKKYEL